MDAAWEAGLRWFDTADAYGGGRSETYIGEWIRSRRPEGLRLTTKTFNPMAEGEDHGLAPARVRRQIDTSLGRLGVERVDLYLAHAWDDDVPVAELAGVFEELVTAGKIGAYGLSNVDGEQLVARRLRRARSPPSRTRTRCSTASRRTRCCRSARSTASGSRSVQPALGGWLTGKYRRGRAARPRARA